MRHVSAQDDDRGCGNMYVPHIGDTVQYRAPRSPSGTWEGTVFGFVNDLVRIATQDAYGERVNTSIARCRIIRKVSGNYTKA